MKNLISQSISAALAFCLILDPRLAFGVSPTSQKATFSAQGFCQTNAITPSLEVFGAHSLHPDTAATVSRVAGAALLVAGASTALAAEMYQSDFNAMEKLDIAFQKYDFDRLRNDPTASTVLRLYYSYFQEQLAFNVSATFAEPVPDTRSKYSDFKARTVRAFRGSSAQPELDAILRRFKLSWATAPEDQFRQLTQIVLPDFFGRYGLLVQPTFTTIEGRLPVMWSETRVEMARTFELFQIADVTNESEVLWGEVINAKSILIQNEPIRINGSFMGSPSKGGVAHTVWNSMTKHVGTTQLITADWQRGLNSVKPLLDELGQTQWRPGLKVNSVAVTPLQFSLLKMQAKDAATNPTTAELAQWEHRSTQSHEFGHVRNIRKGLHRDVPVNYSTWDLYNETRLRSRVTNELSAYIAQVRHGRPEDKARDFGSNLIGVTNSQQRRTVRLADFNLVDFVISSIAENLADYPAIEELLVLNTTDSLRSQIAGHLHLLTPSQVDALMDAAHLHFENNPEAIKMPEYVTEQSLYIGPVYKGSQLQVTAPAMGLTAGLVGSIVSLTWLVTWRHDRLEAKRAAQRIALRGNLAGNPSDDIVEGVLQRLPDHAEVSAFLGQTRPLIKPIHTVRSLISAAIKAGDHADDSDDNTPSWKLWAYSVVFVASLAILTISGLQLLHVIDITPFVRSILSPKHLNSMMMSLGGAIPAAVLMDRGSAVRALAGFFLAAKAGFTQTSFADTPDRVRFLVSELDNPRSNTRKAAREELIRLSNERDARTQFPEVRNAIEDAFNSSDIYQKRHRKFAIARVMRILFSDRADVMVNHEFPDTGKLLAPLFKTANAITRLAKLPNVSPIGAGESEQSQIRYMANIGRAFIFELQNKNLVNSPSLVALQQGMSYTQDFYATSHFLSLAALAQTHFQLFTAKPFRDLLGRILDQAEVDPEFMDMNYQFKVGTGILKTMKSSVQWIIYSTRELGHNWVYSLNPIFEANTASLNLKAIDELAGDVLALAMLEKLGILDEGNVRLIFGDPAFCQSCSMTAVAPSMVDEAGRVALYRMLGQPGAAKGRWTDLLNVIRKELPNVIPTTTFATFAKAINIENPVVNIADSAPSRTNLNHLASIPVIGTVMAFMMSSMNAQTPIGQALVKAGAHEASYPTDIVLKIAGAAAVLVLTSMALSNASVRRVAGKAIWRLKYWIAAGLAVTGLIYFQNRDTQNNSAPDEIVREQSIIPGHIKELSDQIMQADSDFKSALEAAEKGSHLDKNSLRILFQVLFLELHRSANTDHKGSDHVAEVILKLTLGEHAQESLSEILNSALQAQDFPMVDASAHYLYFTLAQTHGKLSPDTAKSYALLLDQGIDTGSTLIDISAYALVYAPREIAEPALESAKAKLLETIPPSNGSHRQTLLTRLGRIENALAQVKSAPLAENRSISGRNQKLFDQAA